jgi:hypothetical protein
MRATLFEPYVKLSPDLVSKVLKARGEEIDEATANSPLKSATDREGQPLGSLKEMNRLAQQELDGTLRSENHVLKKELEIITDEEETRVRRMAKDHARDGLFIKNGNIVIKSFPSQNKRDMASNEAQRMKQDFLKGKERLQEFAAKL